MNQVTENVWVGGWPWIVSDAQRVLRETGITHIIRSGLEFMDGSQWRQLTGAGVLEKEFVVHVIPVEDDGKPRPSSIWLPVFDFVHKMCDNSAAKLLVHCAGGVHRGPAACYGALRVMGVPSQVAKEKITTARKEAEFQPVVIQSVDEAFKGWRNSNGS